MSSIVRTWRRAYARRKKDWMENMKRTAASKQPKRRNNPAINQYMKNVRSLKPSHSPEQLPMQRAQKGPQGDK